MKYSLSLFFLCLSITAFSQNSINYLAATNSPSNTPKLGNKKNNIKPITRIAPKNYWSGATIGYNLEGEGSDNIVGSGIVELEAVNKWQDSLYFDLLIVGNLAKVTNSIAEDPSDDITEIVQSNQGLNVGFSAIWVTNRKKIETGKTTNIFRHYLGVGYKLNGFQDVGANKETINLHQFRASAGFEFEGLNVVSGSPITFSTELIYSLFSKNAYNDVFGEEKTSLLGLENTVIIPIGERIGFLLKHTLSNENVFQIGFVVKKK